ncbi:hypothetical protein RB608_25430 [Nocardioides sp. LHD-245]|uniref:hypothetical protein n=1 Tax=Nocardioides sp. LHD-245 TaxID=3051387 RepID=UPI0027E1A6F8|nr:hypothetical protein [Nocardioides sp. LHD-245]
MDISPAWLILGVVIAAFIVLGLVWAFVADRRRNEDVAHDPERVDPTADRTDHTPPGEPADPDRDRLHVDPRHRGPSEI